MWMLGVTGRTAAESSSLWPTSRYKFVVVVYILSPFYNATRNGKQQLPAQPTMHALRQKRGVRNMSRAPKKKATHYLPISPTS